jgi:hypothetical protein
MANRTAKTPAANTVGGKTTPRTKPIKLATLAQIADELGRLYREARVGKVKTQDATRLAYILTQLRTVLVDSDLEIRLKAIEEALG